MIYFTSDLHFLHKNIIKFNRPYYSDVASMNEAIVETINARVTPEDTLYILGDVALGSIVAATSYLERINCQIKIVPGNHDSSRGLRNYNYLPNVEVLPQLHEINIGDNSIVMCHFPMVVWNCSHHGSWHLFGHTHGSYAGLGKSLDVGWDNYYKLRGEPGIFSYNDLVEIMSKKEVHQVSHHSGDRN